MNNKIHKFLVFGFAALLLLSAACSSDDDNDRELTDSAGNVEATDSTSRDTTATDTIPRDTTVIDTTAANVPLMVDSVELWCMRDSNKIYGKVYYTPTLSERHPAVILSHSSSLTHEAMSGYALAIARMGYVAYCFDFCGGSSKSQSDGSEDDMTVFTEVEDLRSVVKTVRSLSYVDPSCIYLLGSSQGGLVSALLADECPDDFVGMILFYPAFNIPELVSKFSGFGNMGNMGDFGDFGGFGGMMSMSETYINSIKDYDVWAHIGKYSKPVCIVHGTSDFIVPIANSEKAAGIYPNAKLHPIEGANHGFNSANLGSMGSMMGAAADCDSMVMPIVKDFLNGK